MDIIMISSVYKSTLHPLVHLPKYRADPAKSFPKNITKLIWNGPETSMNAMF